MGMQLAAAVVVVVVRAVVNASLEKAAEVGKVA